MKTPISSNQRMPLSAIAVFARLGWASLLTAIIATSFVWNNLPTKDESTLLAPARCLIPAGRPHGLWYLQSGQWQADARTVIAAFRYLLENDATANDRKSKEADAISHLAMPTNSSFLSPKA